MALMAAKFRYERFKKQVPNTSNTLLRRLLIDFKDKKQALENEIPMIQSVIDCIEEQLSGVTHKENEQ